MLIYLYGLAGAGKNYVGGVLEDTFGFTFYDADLDLTDELREAVRTRQPFTDAMRDRYFAVIIRRIGELVPAIPFLAFGQATFKERHRQQILAAYPDTIFVLVTADFALRMERLRRGNNPISADYARQIDRFFEPPQHPTYHIDNSGARADVADQCLALLTDLALTGQA
jgi:gluconate kinase